MAPANYNAMDALGRTGGAAAMISASASGVRETQTALNDFVPESRKRKIEEVDSHQQDDPVRLGLHFKHEGGSGISPSSYRTYTDFPRSSYPPQMPAPATTGRFSHQGSVDEEDSSTVVRKAVVGHALEDFRDHATVSSVDRAGVEEPEGHGYRPVRDRVRMPQYGMDWPRPVGEFELFGTTKLAFNVDLESVGIEQT